MSQINALAVTKRIRERMTRFALDDNFVQSTELRSALNDLFSSKPKDGGICSDLWVEAAFPSKSYAKSLQDIINAGEFSEELGKAIDASGEFPLNRKPYTHQAESLFSANAGYRKENGQTKPSIVISAKTGAGKTESFLLPMLNDIYRANPKDGEGVSAIILYPMNALVNDQVDRLTSWLSMQSQANFVSFTSDTPETVRLAEKRGLHDLGPHTYRSRNHARGLENRDGRSLESPGPVPRILITNYSMLEYMLCRPQDYVFFGKNLRTLVLDEAHLYTGNLAAEISLLLQRTYQKCGVSGNDVLQFATSATIGGTGEGNITLKNFASKLFNKPKSATEIILGKTIKNAADPNLSGITMESQDAKEISATNLPTELPIVGRSDDGSTILAEIEQSEWERLIDAIRPLYRNVSMSAYEETVEKLNSTRCPAKLLSEALPLSPVVNKAIDLLYRKPCLPLDRLSEALFGSANEDSVEASRRILSLGAMARKNPFSYPILPNRIHFLNRSAQGALVYFNPENASNKERIVENRFWIASMFSERHSKGHTSFPLSLARCEESGQHFFAAVNLNGNLTPLPISVVLGYATDDPINIEYYTFGNPETENVRHYDPTSGQLGARNAKSIPLKQIAESPATGIRLTLKNVGFFGRASSLQLGLLTESALSEMPAFPDDSKSWKPAEGRRLLVFSDSRNQAARLGPRLGNQHEQQVMRAAIVETLEANSLTDPAILEFLKKGIEERRGKIAELPERHPIREELEKEIADYESRLNTNLQGKPIQEWARLLAENQRFFEVIHRETADTHTVDNPDRHWSQKRWEANRDRSAKKAMEKLEAEFITMVRGGNRLEPVGLAEVIYFGAKTWDIPSSYRATLPSELEKEIEELWPELICAILDEMRGMGAITLGRGSNDDYEFEFAPRIGGYLTEQTRIGNLLPIQSARHSSKLHLFFTSLFRKLGASPQELDQRATELLNAIFLQLCEKGKRDDIHWLEWAERQSDTGSNVPAVRLKFDQLGLQKPAQLFRCEITGTIWPRSIKGTYIGNPKAQLHPVTEAELDKDPRYGRIRIEFKDAPLFKIGLWTEEHSAQLDPKENLRIQNLFKDGVRNVLSSTTTLELGIDIGGLNGVLMSNIPPGKANYLQRAGRAGRRADGSALVLGYARANPYERDVFQDFRNYLEAPLPQPTVFLEREELVWRHIHASLLGHFFSEVRSSASVAGAMHAFGRMGTFCGLPEIPFWKSNSPKPTLTAVPSSHLHDLPDFAGNQQPLSTHFLEFLEQLEDKHSEFQDLLVDLTSANSSITQKLQDEWKISCKKIFKKFDKTLEEWKNNHQQLIKRWEALPQNDTTSRAAATAIYHQAHAVYFLTVIESLGDALVIPRYGFPIGLSQLRVSAPDARNPQRTLTEDQYRLQRSSMLAIREYVPGSKIIVGGKLVTSRGILKHWTGDDVQGPDASLGLRAWFVCSREAGKFDYSTTGDDVASPSGAFQVNRGQMLFAKHGFTSAAWDQPKFSQKDQKIGRVDAYTKAFNAEETSESVIDNFAGLTYLRAQYQAAGEIILLNTGANGHGFAVCTKCGYTDSEPGANGRGRMNLPRNFENHASLFSPKVESRCWSDDEAPVLRNQHLAAKQKTNLLLFDLSPWLSILNEEDRKIANTVTQCLRLAGCRLRDLDIREITGLKPTASPVIANGCAIVLFESIAGGSGHLFDMMHGIKKEWWERAARLLNVGDGEDSEREQRMLRRIVTADSPSTMGVPDYDPLKAERLFQCILNGTSFALDLSNHGAASSSANGATSSPTPSIDQNKMRENYAARKGFQKPDDNVTLEDVADGLPDDFKFWLTVDKPAMPLRPGTHRFVKQTQGAAPTRNQVVIIRHNNLPYGIAFGKWQARSTENNGQQVVRITGLRDPDGNRCNNIEIKRDEMQTLEWALFSED